MQMEGFNLALMNSNLLESVDYVIIVSSKLFQTTKKLKLVDKNKVKNILNCKFFAHQGVKCLN